jgi:putative transposase
MLQRSRRRSGRSAAVRKTHAPSAPPRLGRLCQAGLRWAHAGTALSRRYTHRVAISNHRLLAFDQERVTFRWKDYAHGGKQGKMTLAATEFLRRFFLHVLPRGFVRIRHFGFLANRFRSSRLALSRQLLSSRSSTLVEAGTCQASAESSSVWHCPRCGAAMIVMQRFTAAELSICSYFDSS